MPNIMPLRTTQNVWSHISLTSINCCRIVNQSISIRLMATISSWHNCHWNKHQMYKVS